MNRVIKQCDINNVNMIEVVDEFVCDEKYKYFGGIIEFVNYVK